nr:UTP--glucose-1-phosphate uridylyltransferase [Fredinandcohnia onubensis]
MIKKAVIPAAGYGTRNLPITKVIPKEMFPINGKPAIHYIVEEAVASGIEEILIIVSRSKNAIIDYFDDSPELEAFLKSKNKQHLLQNAQIPKVHIQFVRQSRANGLGDAISLAKRFVGNDPFAVLLPDDLIFGEEKAGISELIDLYKQHKENVIALKEVHEDELKNYGVIKGEEMEESLYLLEDIVEKPVSSPPSNLAVIGRYILSPSIFEYLDQVIPGAGGEYQLTDGIKLMLQHDKCYGKVLKGQRYDIGKMDEYLQLINRFGSI